ncbi:MAG TPA: M48 family metalloprotease [Candidatus Babeliales bacterium]|nr:M48 family metalloprotease [Candidatus Babeliales bacterium]
MDKSIRLLSYFFCVLYISFSLLGNTFDRSDRSLLDPIISKLANLCGTESLSDEKVKLIRDTAHEIGVTQQFEIRKMSALAIAQFGLYNAFVFFDYLFVSEEFFEKLDYHERRFLIGHELMHIKKKHMRQRLFLSGLLFCNELPSRLLAYVSTKFLYRNYFSSVTGMVALIRPLVVAGYTRAQEKEADLGAALLLCEAQGGVSLFEKMEKFAGDEHENYYAKWYNRILATHPNFQERKRYLQEIACQQEKNKQK